jgi:hypothetical protein
MDHRIRFSLNMGPGNKLSGQVEADETFGGKARNMHTDKRAEKITGTGGRRPEEHRERGPGISARNNRSCG